MLSVVLKSVFASKAVLKFRKKSIR
jgi:hypothetical protein